ncbi:MAG: substrate-binding domain-containing protein [Oscillospiraceae bacterium]
MGNWNPPSPFWGNRRQSVASGITIASFWLPWYSKAGTCLPGPAGFRPGSQRGKGHGEALDAGEADVALVEGACPAGAYQCRRFASYSLAAVCAPDFPAPGGTLDFQQLCALPLLLRETGSAVRTAVDSALYLHGLQVRPKWVSVNSGALLEAAKAGLGVAILPEQLVLEEIRRNGVRQISLGEPGLENSLWSVLRAQSVPNGAVQNLLEQIYHGSWGSQAVQTQPDGKSGNR